jgi:hypothetical protein
MNPGRKPGDDVGCLARFAARIGTGFASLEG